MERDRKFFILVSLSLVLIFAFSYGVGYFVGKQAGIKEEKQKCELEKKQLIKTLAKITPVSRPQPQIEEKVIKEEGEEEEAQFKEENTQAKVNEQEKGQVEKEAIEKEEKVKEREEIKEVKEEIPVQKEGLYYLQVGVFKNKSNAVKLEEELKEKGFDAKTEFFNGYARVIVGYFNSLDEVKAVKKELLEKGYKSIVKRRKG